MNDVNKTKPEKSGKGTKSEPSKGVEGAGEINASEILSTKAMLASVSITSWGASRKDSEITERVNSDNDSDDDAGRWIKQLVPRETMRDIVSAAGAARNIHYAYTMPWLDDGSRILAAEHYPQYSKEMREAREAWEEAVEIFVATYPTLVKQAAKRLGKAFNPMDYPDASALPMKFTFNIDLMNVPATRDWRVELDAEAQSEIKANIERRLKDVLNTAMADTFDRIAVVMENMVRGLREYVPATSKKKAEHVFKNSLVENVRSLIDLLPGLNLTNDPRLDAMIVRLKDVAARDAGSLKDDDKARAETADKAAAILSDIQAYLA